MYLRNHRISKVDFAAVQYAVLAALDIGQPIKTNPAEAGLVGQAEND